jgi:dCTP deaminase
MTVLPDWEIRKRSSDKTGDWEHVLIEDFDEDQLQPSSYDVKLDYKILVPRIHSQPVDIRDHLERDDYASLDITKNGYLLAQGRFILGSTQEWVNIHTDIVGRIEGKSSRARQGLQIHSAGYLDPGFRGNVTLEIVNFSMDPLVIWPDVFIAQLSFEHLTGRCHRPYSKERNHYQDSHGAIGGRA